jgi:hypothetical protein
MDEIWREQEDARQQQEQQEMEEYYYYHQHIINQQEIKSCQLSEKLNGSVQNSGWVYPHQVEPGKHTVPCFWRLGLAAKSA